MIILNFFRSLIFYIFFISDTIVCCLVSILIYFINKKYFKFCVRTWAKIALWGLRYICGLRCKVEGEIPKEPFLIVSKHQSALECIFFFTIFDEPKFILKREIKRIPLVGTYCVLAKMIFINRESLKDLMGFILNEVRKSIVNEKRTVILFPEGTRTEYGEKTKCKAALPIIQKGNDFTDICPVVVNTGKFWGKNSFIKKPGVATIRFLPILSRTIPYKDIGREIEKIMDQEKI